MERVGLKEAIEALRTELSASILEAADKDLRFEVGEISMEFQFEVERAVEGSTGIKFWVVELGGKGSRTTTSVHTVTIPLKPVSQDGTSPVLTGSETAPD
jgi:hypothetical protein